MYNALGNVIDPTHLTGLQRVNGMWRIYVDNLEDKTQLVSRGVTLRGKTLPILLTNPQRLDYEDTTRVRIQNIPLSVEDGVITRTLVLKGLEVISTFREKLRINNKLTNCETGDRIVNVKYSSLKEPLDRFMQFGQFKAKVIHKNQRQKVLKCSKCLETGHSSDTCTNDWKCLSCNGFGHKQGECPIIETQSGESSSESSEDEDDGKQALEDPVINSGAQGARQENLPVQSTNQTVLTVGQREFPSTEPPAKADDRVKRKVKKNTHKQIQSNRQPQIERFMESGSHETERTPSKSRSGSVVRSPPTPSEDLCDKTKKSRNNRE